MGHKYTEVLWVFLSEPNGTVISRQFIDYCRFFWQLSKHVKCHIHWRAGIEDGKNSHGHFIVSVPVDRKEYFTRRMQTFKAWKSWRFRTLSVKEWETGHQTYGYTVGKHDDYGFRVECPRTERKCRRGNCGHIIKAV